MQDTIIVIPTLNEADNIGLLIKDILSLSQDYQVLIVDDNSSDDTQQVAMSLGTRVHLLARTSNYGYGPSVMAGLEWALTHNFEKAVSMDADFSHDPKVLNKIVSVLKGKHADFVIGSRYCAGGGIANWKLHRRLLSKYANLYVKLVLRAPISDMTSGFVGYSRQALMVITGAHINSSGYAFCVETKYVLHKLGLNSTEIPITFTDRREGKSKMSGKKIFESILLPWKLLLKVPEK